MAVYLLVSGRMYNILLFLFLFSTAYSYVPRSDFILSMVVSNHGSGNYRISNELSFDGSEDNVVVRETWNIASGRKMHLVARGNGVLVERYYDYPFVYEKTGGKKGKVKKLRWPGEFFEDLFVTRSLSHLKNIMVRRSLTNSSALGWNPTSSSNQRIFLTQGKNGTNYTYLNIPLNRQSLVDLAEFKYQKPGLWIDQDRFVISRVQLKDSQVIAEDYAEFSKKLLFPKNRHIKYGDNEITASVTDLDWKSAAMMSFGVFRGKSKSTDIDHDNIKEFYTRFR